MFACVAAIRRRVVPIGVFDTKLQHRLESSWGGIWSGLSLCIREPNCGSCSGECLRDGGCWNE